MKCPRRFLAFDLGAESGRAMLGELDGRKLRVREVSRFPNRMLELNGHLFWDVWRLLDEVKAAMRSCAEVEPTSIGIDTWGVDFGLLAADGTLLGLPYSYRDERTAGAMARFLKLVPKRRVYEMTGIQFLPINTLYQLYSMRRDRSPLLDVAKDLLFMPDLFVYLLTGRKATEFTIATTSQLYNPARQDWARELFGALGLSRGFMQEVVQPGTEVGRLSLSVASEVGLKRTRVVATASHDTAAAVAAVPAEGDAWMFISAGTWSLVGVEVERPVTSGLALKHNFTNEGGVGGRFQFLKNVTGFWLLQQLVRSWGVAAGYGALVKGAEAAVPLRTVLDPDATCFRGPKDMGEAIADYSRRTRQPVPRSRAEQVRAVLESLPLKYRLVRDELEKVTGRKIERVHIVGGGARNRLLCQMTADALGLPVSAGPAEATAIGNIMVQAVAAGQVSSLEEIRTIVRESFRVRQYEPRPTKEWDTAYERFRGLAGEKA
jgi:rhamnulokinase